MKRIHIIDNSAFNRKQVVDTLLNALFTCKDAQLVEFDNVEVARHNQYSQNPDVVFVNASFPESFSYIQEMSKSSKVVAMINHAQISLALEAKRMGADEVVFMPSDPFRMRQVINQVLGEEVNQQK